MKTVLSKWESYDYKDGKDSVTERSVTDAFNLYVESAQSLGLDLMITEYVDYDVSRMVKRHAVLAEGNETEIAMLKLNTGELS